MVKRSREDSNISISDVEASPAPDSQGEISNFQTVSSSSEDVLSHSFKYALLDNKDSEQQQQSTTVMRCSLPPHPQGLSFPSLEAYDVHYAKFHVNRCSECQKNFPTEHYLELHIEENHDPLNEARRARGEKTYGCFVDDCDRKCSTPQKRRMHLIDKHMFPKNYDFIVINDGIDKRSSLLRSRPGHRRRSSAAAKAAQIEQRATRRNSSITASTIATSSSTISNVSEDQGPRMGPDILSLDSDVSDSAADTDRCQSSTKIEDFVSPLTVNQYKKDAPTESDSTMMDLADSMSALKFVPPSVRFGRGRGKSGLSSR
ncbi:MAG: hypothetical protein M1827_000552 [Pycnora praestabilis]|nr:MAG: hypothetical protein M1827_000552 [Pycnora praestabilis]